MKNISFLGRKTEMAGYRGGDNGKWSLSQDAEQNRDTRMLDWIDELSN